MKSSRAILVMLFAACVLWAAIVPAAAQTETPTETILPPVTPEPTLTVVTPPPTTEPTTVPTTEPTTIPTTRPTTEPTTVPTTEPTKPPTTEPTITIPPQPSQVGGGKGWIQTFCNVDGASVSFNGAYRCTIAQGQCTAEVATTGTPVSSITVTKSGYTAWTGAPPRMPGDGETVSVTATLNPVPPQTGTIYAQSSPAGAAIYLNGNFYGYSPVTIPNLAVGSYSMKASLSGYTPDAQTVSVYAGQTATYYPVLQASPPPPRSTGTVRVTSDPSAAQVYVDGNYQGKTPITVTLYPGTHAFRVSMTGYNDYNANVYVNANSNQNLNAVLNPAVYGTVQITSLPGASVFMDSNAQGKIPPAGMLTLYNVANGNRLFKVTATGYNDWINTIYVQPNTVTPINAVLVPSGGPGPTPTPVAATGSIQLVSTPNGAEVYVDNLFKGYTPATLDGIAAGQHILMLKYTGYVDYTQTVTVNAGQTTPVAVSMQPAPTPTPASPLPAAAVFGSLAAAAGLAVISRRRS